MNVIRFTSTFKPDGKDYAKVTMWNRYIQNKTLLVTLFIPTVGALYFLYTNPGPFWWIFLLIMLYPLYSVIGFSYKIKKQVCWKSNIPVSYLPYVFRKSFLLQRLSYNSLGKCT